VDTLELTKKTVSLSRSERLMDAPFQGGALDASSWIAVGNADWTVRNGALEGVWSGGELEHGQIFSRQTFAGDVLMEFFAGTVPPCANDIIWWWQTELKPDSSSWEHGYLGCLGGWWDNKTGIEKLEGESSLMATTPLFKLEPGRNYKIHSGCVDGTSFIFIDGQLIMEFSDPNPPDSEQALRIGFGIYHSHIRISGLQVYKPAYRKIET
jgi:hypothetical protein